ncbi:MAG: peptide ABC transporter substrate-binding protein [Anaerolineae bacterium]
MKAMRTARPRQLAVALVLAVVASSCRLSTIPTSQTPTPPPVLPRPTITSQNVVVVTSTSAPAPTIEREPATPTATPGPKSLTVCIAQEPDSLYLYGTTMLAARHLLQAIYDGPIDSRSYAYQPVILEKLPGIENGDAVVQDVTVQPGEMYVNAAGILLQADEPVETQRLAVTFKLKQGITWEDGEPVTAHDSVYSFNLAAHPDTPASKFMISRTASYEALDKLTIRWTGVPGFIDATYYLNFWTPLPQHAMDGLSPSEILRSDFARDPLSYGAFTLEEWVAGDHITLKKNPHYFRADEGLPKVDSVIFRFVVDPSDLLAGLLAGECDIGTHDGLDLDQSPALLQAEAQGLLEPSFIAGSASGALWEHIDFNIWPADERVPIGACRDVRKAFAYGTDRQKMVDVALFGQSRVQQSFIPQGHPMYSAEVPMYEFDPGLARKILEEAGWRDADGNGIREAHDVSCERISFETKQVEAVKIPDGTPLRMTLNTTVDNEMRQQVAESFRKDMANIGIRIELEYLPDHEFFAGGPAGPLFGRQFDLGEFAWLAGAEPRGDLYRCDQVPTPDNNWVGNNHTGWCNPDFDQMTNKALDTWIKEDQKLFWAEAQRIFAENLPALPLFVHITVAATRPEIGGFVVDPSQASEMTYIEQFDVNR